MTTVETGDGLVEGITRGSTTVYRGIPYAASTAGSARWQAPEPRPPWTGVREATSWAPAAPQPPSPLGLRPGAAQSEDCLAVNVWTPSRNESLPVMVWFHGGGFTGGTGATPWYSGTRLAGRGVVVVTVNYRLGALGFLDLSGLAPDRWPHGANVGLLDQQAALRWVRDNIAGFGGDPDRVTIFGESAGAMSTALHLVMRSSTGLFDRAIMQSGALAHARSPERSREVADRLLARLGGRLDRLTSCSTEEVLAAQVAIAPEIRGPLPFMPTTDGQVVPTDPPGALAEGSAAGVPVIIGTTRDEARLFTAFDPDLVTDESISVERFERLLDRHGATLGAEAVTDIYRRRLGPAATHVDLLSAAMTDTEFRVPAARLADLQSAHADVFTYLFTWSSDAWEGRLGSCHALEIPFVFDNLEQPGVAMLVGEQPPKDLARAMADGWVAFAAGRPLEVDGAVKRISWPRHDEASRPTMVFDTTPGIELDPLGEERAVWMQSGVVA